MNTNREQTHRQNSAPSPAPRSAVRFIERAADACYAAGDDARAFELYSEAAYLYRQAGDLDGAAECAAMQAQLRKAVA